VNYPFKKNPIQKNPWFRENGTGSAKMLTRFLRFALQSDFIPPALLTHILLKQKVWVRHITISLSSFLSIANVWMTH